MYVDIFLYYIDRILLLKNMKSSLPSLGMITMRRKMRRKKKRKIILISCLITWFQREIM